MRILITESQLDKVIDSYLKNALSGKLITNGVVAGSSEHLTYWYLGDRIIFSTVKYGSSGKRTLHDMDPKLVRELIAVFNIPFDDAKEKVFNYVKKNIINKK